MKIPLKLVRDIREDFQSHGSDWTKPGFQALAVHRFGKWTRTIETKIIRKPLSLLAKTGFVFCRNFYGIELPIEATIGRWTVIEHQGGIVVHGNASIGEGCTIRQGCTLGCKTKAHPLEAPTLGNNVDVGCGSAILGSIIVGNGCVIGANSIVTESVPDDTVVVGNNKWIRSTQGASCRSGMSVN